MKVSDIHGTEISILIADDVPEDLALLSRLLSDYGYSVRTATDGASVLQLVDSIFPNLILLGSLPSEMDNLQLCQQLKSDKRTDYIPIILVNQMNDEVSRLRAFEAGGVDYIAKPLVSTEVLARVTQCMCLPRLPDSAEYDDIANVIDEACERKLRQLRWLFRTTIISSDQERKKFAQELRDEIFQLMSVIKLDAELIHEEAQVIEMDYKHLAGEIATTANRVELYVQAIMERLYPLLLEELGLLGTLQQLVSDWERKIGTIACTFSAQECVDRLDEWCQINLYRILQEALDNIATHVEVKHLDIKVDSVGGNIRLALKSDDENVLKDIASFGRSALGIRERVAAMEGRVTLSSDCGQGLLLQVLLPLVAHRH